MNLKMTPIAIALAAFVAAPAALAWQPQHRDHHKMDPSSLATINDTQMNVGNSVTNTRNTNNGTINNYAGSNTHGNIAINTAAGDNNYQDNAAAIAKQNASFVFGGAVASVSTNQQVIGNYTSNTGNNNTAGLNGMALYNASGNVGVNSAAGTNNVQKNNMSISVANAAMSKASISSIQSGSGNNTSNTGSIKKLTDTTNVTLNGSLKGYYGGVAWGGTSSSQSGSYSGSYQGSAGGSVTVGHHPHYKTIASYHGGESGRQSGTYSGTSKGKYKGYELGIVGLSGTFSGQVNTVRYVVTPSVNNSSLNGNALEYANGNVAVNVAAGSGNIQNNSMALATSTATAGTPQ